MTITIIETPFLENSTNPSGQENLVILGCSGGGGHNMAALAFVSQYKKWHPEVVLEKYTPVSPFWVQESVQLKQIADGVALMHNSFSSFFVQSMVDLLQYPVLPSQKELDAEVNLLFKDEEREYLDMLLDIFPAGYPSAAIWNFFQKNGKIHELVKLINLQEISDKNNYKVVLDFFYTKFSAAREKKPYTKIICTQAMALAALCDAVIYYNIDLKFEESKAPPLEIHLYLSDPLTEGAIHYKNALNRLNPLQQNQIKLYSVGLTENLVASLFKEQHFSALCSIPLKNNPLVRPAFREDKLDNSQRFEEKLLLDLQGREAVELKQNEKIAAIMLGSQGSNDSVKYIAPLLDYGMDKVFVFTGANKTLSDFIQVELQDYPDVVRNKVIILGNQNDRSIVSVLSRCNILIIRSGGLTVMEQMALNHNLLQTVFIHNPDAPPGKLIISGIIWEDKNAELLINFFKTLGIVCQLTSPSRFILDLNNIRLPEMKEASCEPKEQLPYYFQADSPKSPKNIVFFQEAGVEAREVAEDVSASFQLVISPLRAEE